MVPNPSSISARGRLQNYLRISLMAVEVTDYRAHRLLSGKDAKNSF
jgi:hypothetical protein